MSRPRSGSQVLDQLDEDLVWRVREVAALRHAIRSANGANQTALLRAAVPMLYAHWEGYIKSAAISYGRYISSLNLKFSNIRPSFSGLKALSHVRTLHSITRRIFVASDLLLRMSGIETEGVNLPLERHVGNIGNLDYDLFEQIAGFLSIETDSYRSKKVLIDESLLKLRNEIAHGEYLLIDAKGFEELSDEILALIRQFKTDIQNAVALKTYLRTESLSNLQQEH